MNIARYEPRHRGLGLLSRLLDEEFDQMMGRESATVADWMPAVDIREEADRYLLTADLPGVNPDDIDITMENGVLTIQGKRDTETSTESGGYKRYERVRGNFVRRFTLPDTANGEDIAAETRNGVLEVTIPKHPEQTPRKIAVRQA
jgi:HSP20 family protein